MMERQYAEEGMDLKKYILCLLKRLPLLLAAAVGGAVLGALLYMIVRTVPESEREYQAFAKVDLYFAADETGEVYQAYNGYTWNDLMAADPIMNLILASLPADYTREEVGEAIQAEILSDIRILTVTVTTHSAARTDEILAAAVQALETYGTQAKEFVEINAIQVTQAKLLVADDRLVQAVLIGLFLGLLLPLLGVSLYYVMDDRILVAGDVKKVTDVSFLGYVFTGETPADENSASGIFVEDYEKNLSYLQDKMGTLRLCDLEPGKSFSAEDFEKMRNAQGVVLSLPYGGVHGTFLSYVIEQLHSQDCVLCGVSIRNGDRKFLQRYYGVRGRS